jgi:hypothetical protein
MRRDPERPPIETVPNGGVAPLPTVPRDVSLFREVSSSSVYVVQGGARFPIPSPAQLAASGFDPSQIRLLPDGSVGGLAALPRDGTLLKEVSSPRIYIMQNGRKVLITDPFSPFIDPDSLRSVPDGSLATVPG